MAPLSRVCVIFTPSYEVTDILDYEAAFAISSEGLNIQQGMVKSMTERPIATRLDQLIR